MIVPSAFDAKTCNFSPSLINHFEISQSSGRPGYDFVLSFAASDSSLGGRVEINRGHILPSGDVDEISYLDGGRRTTLRPITQAMLNIYAPPISAALDGASASALDGV